MNSSILIDQWQRALSEDPAALAAWDNFDRGNWAWRPDGLRLTRSGGEWYSLIWKSGQTSALLRNSLIEVTIEGPAEAAGLSFGPFRDFVVESGSRPKRLQLEVDAAAGTWLFRVDGEVMPPAWWNSGATSVEDILGGPFALKARRPSDVMFRDLTIRPFEQSVRISVVITCNRFLQRLRLSLRNWCHQDLPSGAHEIFVVNPNSPDGTHAHLRAVSRSYPAVRLREVAVPPELGANKGAMINRALPLCRGEWVWFTDADCLFSPCASAGVLDFAANRPDRLFFGERRSLTAACTDDLLSGRTDPIAGFAALSAGPLARPPENAPWGYTQVIRRGALGQFRYPDVSNDFARSDGDFIDYCRSRALAPEQVPGLLCLHMDHPFAWHGTTEFL